MSIPCELDLDGSRQRSLSHDVLGYELSASQVGVETAGNRNSVLELRSNDLCKHDQQGASREPRSDMVEILGVNGTELISK